MIITRTELAKLFTSTLQLLSITTPTNPSSSIASEEWSQNNLYISRNPESSSYEDNPTVFGRILEGKLPCSKISETETTFTFRDRTPKAPLHALVIPKTFIRSVYELEPGPALDVDGHVHVHVHVHDVQLLEEMKRNALETIQLEQPKSYEEEDFILCFHVPPFISVGHLHLHVLAPASEMKFPYRYGKYQVGTLWCTSLETVMDLMSEGKRFV